MLSLQLPCELYTCDQVKAMDAAAIAQGRDGFELMQCAGAAAFNLILSVWPQTKQLIVLCGGGNNGGDGYVIAALAAQQKMPVAVYSLADPQGLTGEARHAYALAQACGVTDFDAMELPDASKLVRNTVVVDALLGVGVKNRVRADYQRAIDWINATSMPVFAVDLPSGLCGDSGKILGSSAVLADVTLSFIALNRGLMSGRGPACSGQIHYDDLAVMPDIIACHKISTQLLDVMAMADWLPRRKRDAHKGMFGHCAVVGGNLGMGGAVLMAAESALSSGAGLVSMVTRAEHVAPALVRMPEVMSVVAVECATNTDVLRQRLARATCYVVGPGLGKDIWAQQLLSLVLGQPSPKVIDADALNLIAGDAKPSAVLRDCVFTPHPKEAARLLQCDISDIENDRFTAARAIYQRYCGVNCAVLLKGAGTVIADDQHLYICPYGNPGMATGGMGDILAGVIGALLAQGLTASQAARLGACVHGQAADDSARAHGEIGLRATDLLPLLRRKLNFPSHKGNSVSFEQNCAAG